MEGYNKKLSKGGSITIPAVLRREYGLTDGERFKIMVDGEDGTILLQRTEGNCLFCASDTNLIVHHGRYVCSSCVEIMDAEVSEAEVTGSLKGGAVE